MAAELIIINTVIISLAFVVAIKLLSFWKATRISELGLVGLVFLSAYIGIIANIASILTGTLLSFQIAVLSFNSVGILYLLYFLNLHRNRFEKIIKGIGWGWFTLLAILILFWKPFEQPDRANVLFFFELNHTRGDAHPLGAGLKIPYNGSETIIYSTSHQILGILFWFFSVSMSLYQLYKMEIPEKQNEKIQKRILVTRRNFQIERGLHLIWVVSLFPIFGTSPKVQALLGLFNLLVLVSYAIVAYTVLMYPEAMVMSKDQFPRTFQKISEAFVRQNSPLLQNSYITELVHIIEEYNIDDLRGRGIVIKDLEEPYGFYISKSSLIRFSETFQGDLNTLLVANFIAAFSSFSDEIFDQRDNAMRVQRTRNGEYEVYVLIMDNLMFAYLFRGVSLLLNTKIMKLAMTLLQDQEIKNYLMTEKAKQEAEIIEKIRKQVKEIIILPEMNL